MDNLIHRFSVIKKCSSDYDCKIHEALLIKKKFYYWSGRFYYWSGNPIIYYKQDYKISPNQE